MFELDTSILEPLPKNHYWVLEFTDGPKIACLSIYKKRWWGWDVWVFGGLIYKDYSDPSIVYRMGSYVSEYVLMKNSQRIAHEYDVKRLR